MVVIFGNSGRKFGDHGAQPLLVDDAERLKRFQPLKNLQGVACISANSCKMCGYLVLPCDWLFASSNVSLD